MSNSAGILTIKRATMEKERIPTIKNMSMDIKKRMKAVEKSGSRNTRKAKTDETIKGGKKIVLLGDGRLINLAAAEGHPPMVMDMSFANQVLSCEFIVKNRDKLERKVYKVPDKLDAGIAKLKLRSMDVNIDNLTAEQKHYLASWEMGT